MTKVEFKVVPQISFGAIHIGQFFIHEDDEGIVRLKISCSESMSIYSNKDAVACVHNESSRDSKKYIVVDAEIKVILNN